ncbi:spore germination protein [Bacillus pinisoli]|uniref:spore germination protein n=1 Tax=Bacillus pinisoli TaxID=2901866 RepID=UPI001FF4A781|nr:spore germination protein [Bacillus pinisoli]
MFLQKKSSLRDWLKEQLGSSQDVVDQDLLANRHKARLIYIKSICDDKTLQNLIIIPFFELSENDFIDYLYSLSNVKINPSKEDAIKKIMQGSVSLFIKKTCFLVEIPKVINNTIGEATVETVIQGPQNALTEDISSNVNLVRRRYPQSSLRIEEMTAGSVSQTRITIMYDQKFVDVNILNEVKLSIEKLDVPFIQAAGELQRFLTKEKRSLFPTMMITERPDRIALNLSQGKVAILVDGTPFSLIVPAVFYDFMSSMEDLYQSFWISRFIISLRYIGLIISVTLPAFYVGITAFNPELFRVQLALSIAGSRVGVPYPAFLEVFLMLVMMELLTEASVRLPKSIGSTATTVGGLILGQAAVEAGLVSNVMIIIVAAVAISNFVIPINSMSFAMRVVKYLLLASTTFFGMVGLVFSIILVIAYLANLESYGKPYLKLFFESNDEEFNANKKGGKEVGPSE